MTTATTAASIIALYPFLTLENDYDYLFSLMVRILILLLAMQLCIVSSVVFFLVDFQSQHKKKILFIYVSRLSEHQENSDNLLRAMCIFVQGNNFCEIHCTLSTTFQ